MKKGFLQALRFLAFLAVGLLLLWLAFRQTDFRTLAEDLKNARYSWILVSLFFGLVAFLSRARRWILLINPLGYKASFINAYHAVMTGYLANLVIPRLGEVTRCIALGKKEKIPVDQLFGTVLIERAIDLICLLIITFIVLLTSSDEIGKLLDESIFIPLREKIYSIFGVTWIMWLIFLVIAILGFVLVLRYRKQLRRIKVFGRIFDFTKGIINGLKSISSLERKWEFVFHSVVLWGSYAMMTWVVAFALENTSGVTFTEAIFLLVVGGLAMSAPVQGGFGVFHYAISRALIIIENVSMEDGLAYAVLAHESQLIWIAVAGAISFFIISHRKSLNDER